MPPLNYNINVSLTPDLRKRVVAVSKEFRRTMTEIMREGIREKVEQLEKKLDEDRALQAARETQRQSRRTRSGSTPPIPIPSLLSRGFGRIDHSAVSPSQERLNAIVADHAKRIALADDRDETRRLIDAAIRKAKKSCPLTHPTDEEMVRLLEEELTRLRDEGPTETRDLTTIGDDET